MKKMIGYMVTWTTYGTWLQGDKRGYVEDGNIIAGNEGLHMANTMMLKNAPTKLNAEHRKIVSRAILRKSQEIGQKIYAIAVCSNHVHIVVERTLDSIEKCVSYYKNAARLSLRDNGFIGKIWTKGFDNRFCFDETELKSKIRYVERHADRAG